MSQIQTMATIPLRRWIKGGKEQVGELSSTYLECSLRIAVFITEQICDAESGQFHGPGILPPTASVDWADYITVILKPAREIGTSLTASHSARSEELRKEIAQDAEQEGQESQAAWRRSANIDYLNVHSAQIFYNDGANHVNTPREKLHRIYSLGLVFYELFSGGELSPPAFQLISSSNDGDLTVVREGLGTRSRDYNAGACVDFASAVNVSEIAGRIHNDSVQCDGSNKWNGTGSIPNKRRQAPISSTYSISSGKSLSSPVPTRVLYNVSAEHLFMKGLPRPLCDLICNMIDCINGDFRSDDSYDEMSHVRSDLQFMLEKPSIFLHDLDVNKLAQTGLELDDTLFVHDREYMSLQCAYQRSISGSWEMAIITGLSGTGKSTMANRLGNFVIANGGLFLSGKFDQMQHVRPFSAVASAFNHYCDVLAREEESERAFLVASKLRTALASDLYYLAQVIPNISLLLPENFCHLSSSHDCVNAQYRLQYLFCQFVDVIASCFRGPVTLFMDDVQWADSSSISIIGQLLKMSRSFQKGKHFFFLGSCHDDEMGSDHPFWNMVESVKALGFKTAVVKLDGLDKNTVNQTVSMLLHRSPRLVRSLSEIVYQKTKGNPLFMSRLLLSLNREGLLHISLARHRWEWDEEKIQSRKLPDDVAMFFVQSINSLSCDVKVALSFLSCFGAATDRAVIQGLETYLQMRLIEPLNVAIAEGLVTERGRKYYFCHDRFQEAAYSMIDERHRCQQHMNYGLALINLSLMDRTESLFFTAVTQLNLGGPTAVQGNADQYYLISRYNLMAGKKAMQMSDFSSAFAFFDHGILFLRETHWQDQYILSLELFNLAAKCALTIKKLTRLDIICHQLLRNARSFEDTLNISFISASALAYSKVQDSVQCCLTVLSQLGINIPGSASRDDTLNLITQTQSMLSSIADETLLNYPVMTDFKKVMTMNFLAKLEFSLLQANPALQPLITIKMCQLTIEHGLSPMSAIGFAYFGGMVAELGDVRGGYRYTKLAKALLEKFQNNEFAGEVIWLSTEILHYIEPYQTANEYRIEGQRTAIAAGDVHWACMHKLLYASALAHVGVALSVTKEAMANARCFAEEHEHLTSLYFLRATERTVLAFIGDERNTLSDDEMTRTVIQNKNPYQLVTIYFQKLLVATIFNNFNEMKRSAEKFIELKMPSWFLLCNEAIHNFYIGLASFRIFRETLDPLWVERGRRHKEKITAWKEEGSLWNFENKSFLLHAEEYHSNGDFENAQVMYDKAILSARQHKFVHEEALASELAGNFYLSRGNTLIALKHFTFAHGKYLQWGAFAKVRILFAFIQEKFGNAFVAAHVGAETDDSQGNYLNTGTNTRTAM